MRFGRQPKASRIALFIFGTILLLFLIAVITARHLSRELYLAIEPGYSTNVDGTTYIVHRLLLPESP